MILSVDEETKESSYSCGSGPGRTNNNGGRAGHETAGSHGAAGGKGGYESPGVNGAAGSADSLIRIDLYLLENQNTLEPAGRQILRF